MNKKSFAYLFTLGPKIVWSGETPNSLATRIATEPKNVVLEVQEFIKRSTAGDHMSLDTGEMIWCTRDGAIDYGPK